MKKLLVLFLLGLLIGCSKRPIKLLESKYEVLVDEVVEIQFESDKEVELISSDPSIAKILDGKVWGVSVGETTITLKTDDFSIKATIKVLDNPTSAHIRQFTKAHVNTLALTNYTIKITLTEKIGEEEEPVENIFYYKFSDTKYAFVGKQHPIYYEYENDQYFKYTMTLDGYQKEPVKTIENAPFFENIEVDDFEYLNNAYVLKYGKEAAFKGFYENIKDASLTNGRITLSDYFEVITFNLVMSTGEIYQYKFEFIDINSTTVDMPK